MVPRMMPKPELTELKLTLCTPRHQGPHHGDGAFGNPAGSIAAIMISELSRLDRSA